MTCPKCHGAGAHFSRTKWTDLLPKCIGLKVYRCGLCSFRFYAQPVGATRDSSGRSWVKKKFKGAFGLKKNLHQTALILFAFLIFLLVIRYLTAEANIRPNV